MTRFARADGSKASNKRTYEEATPWKEMKADIPSVGKISKTKKYKVKKKKEICSTENINKNEKGTVLDSLTELFTETKTEKSEKKRKISNSNLETEIFETKSNSNRKDKRKNKDLSESFESREKNKKIKIKSNKNIKNENKKNANNSTSDLESKYVFKEINQKDKNGKGEKKKKTSLEEKTKNFVIENGMKYKIFKNGKKKPWFDLPYVENDIMTRYNTYYVKHEDVTKLNQLRESLENEGSLDKKQISNKVLHAERNAHNKLRLQLLRAQIHENKDVSNQGISISRNIKRNFKRKLQVFDSSNFGAQTYNKFLKPEKVKVDLKYEENELMTEFDGYWILKENLRNLQIINNKKIKRIIAERTDGNTNSELIAEEELKHRRLMKKEKRREMRLLKLKLIEIGQTNSNQGQWKKKNQKAGRYLGIDYEENDKIVKFEGFYVKNEAAERLTNLRETMTDKGYSEEEIWQLMKRERRKEERLLKNEKKLFCFKCRKAGHMVSACPEVTDYGNQNGADLCYKCGSMEHMARNCPKNKGDSYSHATCFICNEVGHISRECPDNPKGLYPNGGCCNECGSVEHLKRDCPELQNQYQENTLKASLFQENQEIDSLDENITANFDEPEKHTHKKAKIIRFE